MKRNSRTLLTYYMVYAKWTEQTPRASLRQLWRTTPLWAQIYRDLGCLSTFLCTFILSNRIPSV